MKTFTIGKADAAFGKCFHFGKISIPSLKNKLKRRYCCQESNKYETKFFKIIDKLIPAIIQDNTTKKVLMLGYVNDEALNAPTKKQKK